MTTKLESRLTNLLNEFSAENVSNTPDFILAQYLLACLAAFDAATQQRENWHGRDPRPSLAVCGDSGSTNNRSAK